MSIASEISRLSSVRNDIFTSITNKGVTVPATATFSSCPALIDSITGGGGGSPTSLVNTAFTASGFVSGYRPFTATQNEVPVYDTVSGNYATGVSDNYYMIQIPMQDFSGENLVGYEMTFKFQAWNSDASQIIVVPNSADKYSNQFSDTNIRTDQFDSDPTYQPTLYYHTFNSIDFSQWWGMIQNRSWLAPSFTGDYVYLMCVLYSSPQNIKGEWNYLVQTGTNIPYPTYPTTTTGYITNEISGKESFTGSTYKVPNIYVSGFKNVVYDDSPEGGANPLIPSNINLTSFSSNMLKNNIAAKASYNLNSTAYTYTYGSVVSGYSGFEGL